MRVVPALPRPAVPARDRDGHEVVAVRGPLGSVLGMIRGGATHVAVATDHVIESFRNGLWPGYKTGEGIAPDLLAQFGLLEEVLLAGGGVVWAMGGVEAEAAPGAGGGGGGPWWSSRRTTRWRLGRRLRLGMRVPNAINFAVVVPCLSWPVAGVGRELESGGPRR